MARREDDKEEAQEDVYGDEARENLMEDSEITDAEEGFMKGYDQPEREEEDSAQDAYEKAFETKRVKRKRSKKEEVEEEEEPEDF